MSKFPELRECPDLPVEISEAGKNGDLVFFVGAGVSMLLGLPSWKKLAASVLEDLRRRKYLNYSKVNQLKKLDPKKQLSIAELLLKDNGKKLDITPFLPKKEEADTIYTTINDIGCVCVTTNYDELLSPRFLEPEKMKTGEALPKDPKRIFGKDNLQASRLDEPGTVIHLHGAIQAPETLIVTTKDYLTYYDDEVVQHFLGHLFERKTVLFLGYSLEEAEILEHILRRGGAKSRRDKRRFSLHPFYKSDTPLYQMLCQYYEKSFGVHLLGYIRDYNDYHQLDDIMRSWAPQLQISKPTLADDLMIINKVLENG